MDDCSPHASGLCLCHECKPAVHSTVAGVKRLLDSPEKVEVLQSAKKGCVSRHGSGTSDPSEKSLCSSPGSASFQGSLHFLDDTGHDDLVASSSVPKYDDVVISLDITRYFGDSDDSLLELSDGEEGNSSFTYTEEEIQEILADDCVESEQCLTRKSSLSQNINEESEKDESSSYSGASVISEDANEESKIAEKPNDSVSRECFSVSSECSPSPLNGSASSDENHLQSAQVTRMLFDLDIQELLSLSPIHADDVDESQEVNTLEEAEREASEGIINDCLEYAKTDSSCVLEDSLEGLMSNDWQSLDVDGLGKTPFTSKDVSHFSGHPVGRSTPSSDLARDQRTADESSAPVLLRCPMPLSGILNQELPKATKSCFSRKSDSLEDDEGESTEAEQPSNSIKLSDTAVGQIEQEETTSGKKPGKVIPVPQEVEERLNQRTRILEAELGQRNISIQTVCIYTKETDSYTK
ncbi:S100P-binding protein isoform X1 [Athene cunicularia]|uniref:S100P-binding protein isoform X1 n=1 Tax=Athene cunicularia TaxID=194338 RepID=UPI000EF649EF|nr:S100P-binding protein isoform X1 [Athene cunicularia]XP_026719083.1 S100P-binding protein isoform X1 [Athene cunicularia]XP_026719084.1 S100P-binding protein isoform X1 [Athene cunicularia]XP_026719085.1 S100P-binding protein isoform X1 [Athene cunicularia]